MTKLKNEIENQYGYLEVIKRIDNNKHGTAMWVCKCKCGNITKPISGRNLRIGNTKSCGCLNKEIMSQRATKRNKLDNPAKRLKVRKKISESNMGENNPMYGRKHTIESRQKISESRKGKYVGKDNPSYKHGLSGTRVYWATHSQKRRVLKAKAEGSYTIEDLEYIYNHQQGKCPCCRKFILFKKLTVDHIVPLSWGGSNYASNIQLLCGNCNSSKCNYHDTDYRDYVPLFLN